MNFLFSLIFLNIILINLSAIIAGNEIDKEIVDIMFKSDSKEALEYYEKECRIICGACDCLGFYCGDECLCECRDDNSTINIKCIQDLTHRNYRYDILVQGNNQTQFSNNFEANELSSDDWKIEGNGNLIRKARQTSPADEINREDNAFDEMIIRSVDTPNAEVAKPADADDKMVAEPAKDDTVAMMAKKAVKTSEPTFKEKLVEKFEFKKIDIPKLETLKPLAKFEKFEKFEQPTIKDEKMALLIEKFKTPPPAPKKFEKLDFGLIKEKLIGGPLDQKVADTVVVGAPNPSEPETKSPEPETKNPEPEATVAAARQTSIAEEPTVGSKVPEILAGKAIAVKALEFKKLEGLNKIDIQPLFELKNLKLAKGLILGAPHDEAINGPQIAAPAPGPVVAAKAPQVGAPAQPEAAKEQDIAAPVPAQQSIVQPGFTQ